MGTSSNNHEITICLTGGAMLGPFKATWSQETISDLRELTKDYRAFMQTGEHKRFKYHLHGQERQISHSLILSFHSITAIYDQVELLDA